MALMIPGMAIGAFKDDGTRWSERDQIPAAWEKLFRKRTRPRQKESVWSSLMDRLDAVADDMHASGKWPCSTEELMRVKKRIAERKVSDERFGTEYPMVDKDKSSTPEEWTAFWKMGQIREIASPGFANRVALAREVGLLAPMLAGDSEAVAKRASELLATLSDQIQSRKTATSGTRGERWPIVPCRQQP